jgi:hypothetical protein
MNRQITLIRYSEWTIQNASLEQMYLFTLVTRGVFSSQRLAIIQIAILKLVAMATNLELRNV